MSKRTIVVLNKYDEYIGETTLKKAIRKIANRRAESVIDSDRQLSSTMKAPLVIRMKYFDYYKYKNDVVPYSDNQVFIRDKNICQYWHDYDITTDKDGKAIHIPTKYTHLYKCSGLSGTVSERTIDHVLPVSRGGKRGTFENAVCCCRYCNERLKKNLTPKEAGLRLVREPVRPSRKKGDIARTVFLYNDRLEAHRAYVKMYPLMEL